MLSIKNLTVEVDGTPILKGLNLEVKPGETHAIMGPNGSGKSTLAKAIAGHPDYDITSGTIDFEVNFKKKNLLEMDPHERALEGVFLAFQYPIEIPGVSNFTFLKTSFDSVCKYQGVNLMTDEKFLDFLKPKLKGIGMDERFLNRDVNEGFSGGEKKKNEILQLKVLSPKLAFLDETDSGLDIDALKTVANGVNTYHNKDNAVVLVTHYQRLLDYIKPDYIHILSKGKIVKTGDESLALKLENEGYDWIEDLH